MTSQPKVSRSWVCALLAATLLAGCGNSDSGVEEPLSYASLAPTAISATSGTADISSSAAPTPSGAAGTGTGSTPAGTTRTIPGSTASTSSESDSTSCDGDPCYLPPTDLGFLADAGTPEASGIASSSTDPDLFFIIDDATGTDHVTAIDGAGRTRATITVADLDARNAEALTQGVCADSAQKCLYIGDIGDNGLRRDTITVTRIAEPTVPPAQTGGVPTEIGPVDSEVWVFSYPDGPRNAEAMLIADDGSVIIITKPEGGATPHEIYRGAPGGGEMLLVNTFTPPRPLKPLQSILIGTVVTDASRLPDRVLLLTYDQAIEYLAPTPGADPATFSEWPYRQLVIPGQWQSEGVTYLAAAGLNACGYLVVSEKGGGQGAQLGRVDCAG